MSYTDSLIHELLDEMVRRWIDEHIDYVGEPFWIARPGFVDIFYHWMGCSECLMVPVDSIKRGVLDSAVKK